MFPTLDLKIAPSAKAEIDALLAAQEPGSIPLLLLSVRGVEREQVVEIGFYPPNTLREMVDEYRGFGAQLLYDCHGVTLAVFDDDKLDVLEGRVLTFDSGVYQLKAH